MDVLILFPDSFDRAAFGALPGYRFHFLDGPESHWRPTPGFDPLAYLERCRQYARAHPVDAVLSTHDLGDLVAAILAEELGLPGPGSEAVFLALHKYYGRRRERSPIRCEAVRLDDPHPTVPCYPCYLKAPWLKLGLLGFKLESLADLERALAVARREYPGWARQYYPLFRAHVDLEKYPLAVEDVLLAEEFVEGPQVTVEGWSRHGEPRVWAITDTNTFPGTRVIDNFSLPSRHPVVVQEQLAAKATEAVRAFGLRDGFWNVEFWVRPEGPVLTEVNGRSAASFAGLYEGCLDASIFAATVELACGREPRTLPVPNGRVGGQFNFITFAEDRVENLIDLAAAATVPAFALFRDPGETVRLVSEFGTVLGQIELFGESYEEIKAEADRLRLLLLRG